MQPFRQKVDHRRWLAAVVGVTLTAMMLHAPPAAASPHPGGGGLTPQVEPQDNVGGEVRGKPWPASRQIRAKVAPPVWPSAATGRAVLPADNPQGVRAGTLPVWVERTAGDVTAVTVSTLDRKALPAGLRDGLLMRVGATERGSGSARLTVDYTAFRNAYGGDWSSRLRLWQIPECTLTTPDAKGCQATPLASTNAAGKVAAVVGVPASGTSVVALAAGAAGSGGDFGATSLSSSATWAAGGSAGDFTWNYAMRTPPSIGGDTPSISLAYSSSSVDGRSEATNNQPSWIGEGFDYAPGSIERRYVSCSEDMGGNANNTVKTGDQCWRSDNAVMAFRGGGELIFETGKGWHSRTESGMRIEKLTGAANGDNDGEYWKVTSADGTQYFFGLNRPAGQGTDTNSVFTMPVFGNNTGEPCRASTFANSRCTQAYRWNLDYAIDPFGNTISYWYDQETNKYAVNNTSSDDVSYVRGGTLQRIDYGTWDRGSADRSVTPTAQVVFTKADRCLSNCTTHTDNWPDVPWDQECAAAATSCTQFSPTFWTTKRLSKVTTKVFDTTAAPAAWQDVDSWTLTHTFPPTGDTTHAGLWLDSIVHAGHVGGTVTMPAVTFEPIAMPNRVLTSSDTTNNWQRMSAIVSETGNRVQVTYSLPECTSTNLPSAPETNSKRCYPVLVTNLADVDGPALTKYWHKYVVLQVSSSDIQLTGGHQSPTMNTYYEYVGTPAWHYSDDDGLTQAKFRTWNGYRGYSKVRTRTGDVPGQQTLTETTFMRGMHGDRLNGAGGTRVVTVPASLGSETVYDEDQFSGRSRETVEYNGTVAIAKTVEVPWRSDPPTASRTINGTTATARFVGTAVQYKATALGVTGERGWRTTRIASTLDNTYGTLVTEQNDGAAAAGDEQCTSYTYIRNATTNILRQQQITAKAVACNITPASVDDVISDVRFSYDGATSHTTLPTKGMRTRTEELISWSAGTGTQFQVAGELTHDAYGRLLTAKDLRNNINTTTYTPATGQATLVTTTSPAPYSWVTTKQVNPYWGSTKRSTDANGRIEEATYDPLGRVAKVWRTGWSRTANPTTPSSEYTYSLSATRSDYPFAMTRTLNAKGGYDTAYQIYDGMLRTRQSQSTAVGGGRVVSDTVYDAQGRVATEYAEHAEPGAPGGVLWWEPEWSLRRITRTQFDAASRATATIFLAGDGVTNLVEKWRTTFRYEGDLTSTTPPSGGVPSTVLTDIQGRTVELRHHTTVNGVDGAYNTTKYVFNRKGQQTKTVDPGLNEWVSIFDIRGRKIEVRDPDRGTTFNEYNNYGDLVKTTDARGEVLVYSYDQLGRRVGMYDDSISTATKRAEWKYDRLYTFVAAKGQLTESYRYEPAGSTNAYKWQVVGFDERYKVTGANYVIPEAPLNGTYTYSYTYSPYDGTPLSISMPGAGGLAGETVTTELDATSGRPTSLTTNLPGVGSYVIGQDYSPFGEPTMMTRKVAGGVYVQSATSYDEATRRITRTTVKPETASGTVADHSYTYDNSGNVTEVSDAPQVGTADRQCFRYDAQRRLELAWTPKSTLNCSSTPSAYGDLGGAAPYWQNWTFDLLGNRLTETTHASAGNTVRTYAVPVPGAGVVRPHAATSVTVTAPATSAVVSTFGYSPMGAVASRTTSSTQDQTYTWDAEGHQQQATAGGATTANVYDADGNRLLRREGTGPATVRTLYLPGQEMRADAAGVITGTRYYTFDGKAIASRSSATGVLTWLVGDHQGTAELSIDAATQAVTLRRQTPYGQSRGPAVTWPNGKGFVNGDREPTGLVHIGAREYDPLDGRFLSVDPLLDVNRPMSMQGYVYADGNPVTLADPSGKDPCVNGGGGCYYDGNDPPERIKPQPDSGCYNGQRSASCPPYTPPKRTTCDSACARARLAAAAKAQKEMEEIYKSIHNNSGLMTFSHTTYEGWWETIGMLEGSYYSAEQLGDTHTVTFEYSETQSTADAISAEVGASLGALGLDAVDVTVGFEHSWGNSTSPNTGASEDRKPSAQWAYQAPVLNIQWTHHKVTIYETKTVYDENGGPARTETVSRGEFEYFTMKTAVAGMKGVQAPNLPLNDDRDFFSRISDW
ncbi:RHS repeat-associated protein [Allocatelliglobosispora scoriae]|uniref:RHS repeat-associated protein n=1 Tax=Allocatelliglobosispora scoriae TaxID=643052 RepID=A0A841BKE7_9ACTN|nr:RHS repeat-associated core domain-containing protein [Allocatelliglobosispora scoriae]MBB5867706.1 RHS repeat-associated protein [Allocatelliglobosispora scoriae]